MIKQEVVEIDRIKYKHIYSTENVYIQKEHTDELFADVYDLLSTSFRYVETDQQIPVNLNLKLTRGDVFRGILQAKGVTRAQLRAVIEAMPETTTEEKLAKELALIDFDEALYFYRRNPLIDSVGQQLGITNYQMTKFFETNDYHQLLI